MPMVALHLLSTVFREPDGSPEDGLFICSFDGASCLDAMAASARIEKTAAVPVLFAARFSAEAAFT